MTGGEGSSRGKPVKRLKRGGNLKAVRVRVEKLQGKKQVGNIRENKINIVHNKKIGKTNKQYFQMYIKLMS